MNEENKIIQETDEYQEDWFDDSKNSLEPNTDDAQNIINDDMADKQTADESIDDIPSANAAGRDGGNKKKLQLAGMGLVGITVILLGIGMSVAKYEQGKEEERVLEAEAAAQDQKKLANGATVDISKYQSNMMHDLPLPSGLQENQESLSVDGASVASPPVQPLPEPIPAPEPYTPVPAYEPVPNSAFMSSAPAYSPPAPVVLPSEAPATTEPIFAQAPAPTVVEESPAPVKGSQGSVLIDVNGVRRVLATNTNDGEQSKVGGNLRPTVLVGAAAGRRGDTSLMLLKGAIIPCVLETKIDSTYQGFTSCRLSRDVYSTNGKTLVLERGTRVVGEQNVDLNQGQARVAILWTRADTPRGVSINLDSPAAGQLGEMGVGAKVKTHFWKRFGNSIMLSLIQDAISAGTKRFEEKNSGGDNNTTIENTSSSVQNMAEQALSNSINIPPTAIINQGSVINISVARDIDFSSVYGVKRR